MILTRKAEDLGENTGTVTLCPLQISNGLYPTQRRASVVSLLTNIK